MVVETSNPEKVLSKLRLPVSKSSDYNGGDFEIGRRIPEANISAAEVLAVTEYNVSTTDDQSWTFFVA